MRILSYLMIVAGVLIGTPSNAFAKINIFACEPEWAALAKEIGQNHVKIKTATNAFTDAHYIRAKPSLIAAIRKSDLVFCSGSELEVGWLPLLLERAKESVQSGNIGHLMASDYVESLEVPEIIDRSHGDIHPSGNPHVHLNPHNITKIANELAKRLANIDAKHTGNYQENLSQFTTKWSKAISRWKKEASTLHNAPIIVHHKSWTYLADWLGLKRIAELEPKPGIPPSASHLQGLIQTLKETRAIAILRTPFEDSGPSVWLSEKTGIPAIVLPFTVGGNEEATDLFSLFDNTIETLLKANYEYGSR